MEHSEVNGPVYPPFLHGYLEFCKCAVVVYPLTVILLYYILHIDVPSSKAHTLLISCAKMSCPHFLTQQFITIEMQTDRCENAWSILAMLWMSQRAGSGVKDFLLSRRWRCARLPLRSWPPSCCTPDWYMYHVCMHACSAVFTSYPASDSGWHFP